MMDRSRLFSRHSNFVILSGADASRSAVSAQSNDPGNAGAVKMGKGIFTLPTTFLAELPQSQLMELAFSGPSTALRSLRDANFAQNDRC
jgi:hypothetical protein